MKLIQLFFLVCLCAILAINVLNAQWVQTNGPKTEVTLSLAVDTNSEGNLILYAGTYSGGIFCSSDYGENWVTLNCVSGSIGDSGFTSQDIRLLTTSPNGKGGTSLFAVDSRRNLFRSINSDTNWTAISSSIGNHPVNAFTVYGTNIFVGTDNGVFLSTNFGTNWTMFNNELTPYCVYSLATVPDGIKNTNLFASTSGGIFLSTNNGTNWTAINTETRDYYGLVVDNNVTEKLNFYAISNKSVFRSTNNGVDWSSINKGLPTDTHGGSLVLCLTVHDTIVYAGIWGYGVYYSLDNGTNWVFGGSASSYALVVGGSYLFAGGGEVGSNASVWRRPLSEMLTDFTEVEDGEEQNPLKFVLNQNYPNPFNPSTIISFNLSKRTFVSLKVFDCIGREVAELMAEELAAGDHTQQWDAVGLSNGVYFYRLQAGTFFQTRKLILIK